MHYVHLIALPLPASSSNETIEAYLHVNWRAPWWDYLTVGGRWEGFFSELLNKPDLVNPDVVPAADGATRKAVYDWVIRHQNEGFLEYRDKLIGAEVAESDVSGHVWGLPVAPTAARAAEMTAHNVKTASEWQQLLDSGGILDARAKGRFGMATYYASKLIDLVEGRWESDTGFYDFVNWTCNPAELLEMPADKLENVCLAAVDFHA